MRTTYRSYNKDYELGYEKGRKDAFRSLDEKISDIISNYNYESHKFEQYSLIKKLFLKLKCYIFNEPLYKYF